LNRCLPIVSSDDPINIGRPRQFVFRFGGSRSGCTDTAQALPSLRRQRFASPLRRLGGLRRSGGRLRASPTLSASTGADLADFDFLTGSCTSTAHLPAPPRRRFASTLHELDASWRPGGRLEDSPTLSPSAGIDLADIVLFAWLGGGDLCGEVHAPFGEVRRGPRALRTVTRGCAPRAGFDPSWGRLGYIIWLDTAQDLCHCKVTHPLDHTDFTGYGPGMRG